MEFDSLRILVRQVEGLPEKMAVRVVMESEEEKAMVRES